MIEILQFLLTAWICKNAINMDNFRRDGVCDGERLRNCQYAFFLLGVVSVIVMIAIRMVV